MITLQHTLVTLFCYRGNEEKLDKEINRRITEGDWSHLDDGEISREEYMKMYKKVIDLMPEIDMERKTKEEIVKSKLINSKKSAPDFDEI